MKKEPYFYWDSIHVYLLHSRDGKSFDVSTAAGMAALAAVEKARKG